MATREQTGTETVRCGQCGCELEDDLLRCAECDEPSCGGAGCSDWCGECGELSCSDCVELGGEDGDEVGHAMCLNG